MERLHPSRTITKVRQVDSIHDVSVIERFGEDIYLSYHTGFLKLTPHHNTGAKFVAQSKVNRLMTHMMTNTGIGASRTSVRLRKGRARHSQ